MLDLKERIDIALDSNYGAGSDDNNDDMMILTPTSSKTSKTSYVQRKGKKEQPISQLAELRKSMQRMDKVIENGSTWSSKNRASPMFAKERLSSQGHNPKILNSSGLRNKASTHSNASKKSIPDASRNEPINNQKNTSFKPVKALPQQSPFTNNTLKVDNRSENRSIKSQKVSTKDVQKESIYYKKQSVSNNKRQGSQKLSQRSSDLSVSSISQVTTKHTKAYKLVPVIKPIAKDNSKKQASHHQRTASSIKRSKSASSLKLMKSQNSSDSNQNGYENSSTSTYQNKIQYRRKTSDRTVNNCQASMNNRNLNADIEEKVINLQSENLKLYFEQRSKLASICENFDFTIFQEVRSNQDSFSVFQRFCLMLLIIHGELERVQQERSDEYLKQLNVYQEIINIKERVDENKYQIEELMPLFQNDSKYENNRLQEFINTVVTYSQMRLNIQKEESSSKQGSETTSNTTSKFRQNELTNAQQQKSDIKSYQYKQTRNSQQVNNRSKIEAEVKNKTPKSTKSFKSVKEYKRDASQKSAKTPVQNKEKPISLKAKTYSQTKSKFVKLIKEQTSQKQLSLTVQNSPVMNGNFSSPKTNVSSDNSPRLLLSPTITNKDLEGTEIGSPDFKLYAEEDYEQFDQSKEAQLSRIKEMWDDAKQTPYDHEIDGLYFFNLQKCQMTKPEESPKSFKSGSQSFRITLKKVESLQESEDEEEKALASLAINKKFTEQAYSQKYFEDDGSTRSSAFEKFEQAIHSNLAYNTQSERRIDMSIIERIKSMRSQSRENSESLSKKRDDTIKQIQTQQMNGSSSGPLNIFKRIDPNDEGFTSQDDILV